MLDAAAARMLRLHPEDAVAIALADLPAGAELPEWGIVLRDPIPRGHKVALRPLAPGEPVTRYGQIIGAATRPVAAGEHVHSHNLGMGEHRADPAFGTDLRPLPPVAAPRHFLGYRRADGGVGTRNYLGVLTTVNCSGSVARFIAEACEREEWLRDNPAIDGVVPIVHGTGCGMAASGEGYETLLRTLRGWGRNPNFAGILVVGLGCEVMQVPELVGARPIRADGLLRHMTIQAAGGTRRTVERGVAILREMAEVASRAVREPAALEHLVVGLQCGGSDGYSGITANPALGHASDLLVAHGGTAILSETPEIYGAEHLLTRRAETPEVGERLLERIRWWEEYTARWGGEMDNNPSPGNKRGGLTTILEKSLGAVAKGGTAPLRAVYRFAEPVTTRGFVFMDSPGYDPCSVTGQIASGANLVCFTTGRGSVSGYKPVPCLKLATNSEMFARLSEDMDIDCGDIVARGVPVEQKGREIFEAFLDVASGRRTRSEELGFGGVEFVPWQMGAVM
ncbi:UxaA family hydrolase [Rubellimicrobium sp. CFH 75288]|uniref:UxaA family hydrolase n=1 Tax=Rubellimicrobium sp. CFH 75288 TaxID=2697034 RepID=UPI00141210D1|nr:altronate dehydratase family protein [Rubellimicrobium sp. CFH 75288]NAZ36392.1 altronate dehydratase [Rubellimicrobium sp. CFH 75288]